MKKFITLIFAAVCFNLPAQGQYKSCLDGNMIRWSFLDFSVADAGAVSTEIIASGETLINGHSYKNIYIDYFDEYLVEETNTNWQNYVPHLGYQWAGMFIRESEDASKLYIYDSWENEEYMISDMNLQVGDVFQIFNNYGLLTDAIVEAVYFENGLKHIRLLGGSPPLTIIEGVGPDKWHISPLGFVEYLNCFKNNSIFYKKESPLEFVIPYSYPCGCNEWGSGISDYLTDSSYELSVTGESINVSFKNEDKGNVSLLEINGKIIYCEKKQQITIPTSSIPKGVYLLRITTKEWNKVHKIIL